MTDSVSERYRRVAHLLTVNQRREFRARFAAARREKESQRSAGSYFASRTHVHACASLAIAHASYHAPSIASAVSTALRESR